MQQIMGALLAAQWGYLPICMVLLILGTLFQRRSCWISACFLYIAGCLDSVLVYFPKIGFFQNLKWNWQGKLIEIVVVMILMLFPFCTKELLGLNWPNNPKIFLSTTVLALVLITIVVTLSWYLNPDFVSIDLESILYQATMPGFAEELVFRGLFLGTLNEILGKPWRVKGISFGWGLILVSIIFLFLHIVTYSTKLNHIIWMTDPFDIMTTFLLGLIMGLLREKSDSIWPGIWFHNLMNVGSMTAFAWVAQLS